MKTLKMKRSSLKQKRPSLKKPSKVNASSKKAIGKKLKPKPPVEEELSSDEEIALLDGEDDSFGENSSESEIDEENQAKDVKGKKKSNEPTASVSDGGSDADVDMDDEDLDEDLEEDQETGKKHKMDLEKLKSTDPELYQFLKENDADLLDFNESDADDEEDEEVDDEADETETKEVKDVTRIPKAKKDSSGRLIFDGHIYDYLEAELDSTKRPTMETVRLASEAFSACVARVGADIEPPKYIINEQSVFEATVRLCFSTLGSVFYRILHMEAENVEVNEMTTSKSKALRRFKGPIKNYLFLLIQFLNEVQTTSVITSTLKAISHLVLIYAVYAKLARLLVKTLVRVWTRKTLECRMLAFVCMNKLVRSHPEHFSNLYKSAYMGFVSNSREVSAETWPLLQFMHRSFAELTLLSPDKAYPYAFVYIRQTAIHLRNAIISSKRKDLVATVYNWQLVQCLYMWARVVSRAHQVTGTESICELAYPLVQIIIGVSKLFPAARYLPLRFHCLTLLIQIQANCEIYVPTFALSVELLDDMGAILSTKPKSGKGKAKNVDIESSIKMHATEAEDSGWRTAALNQMFRIVMQAAHLMSAQAAFPDILLPLLPKLKSFVQKARSPDAQRLFRTLIEKLTQQSRHVVEVLLSKDVDLASHGDMKRVRDALAQSDTPFRVYYQQWERIWKIQQQAQAAGKTSDVKEEKKPKEIKKKEKEVKPVVKVAKITKDEVDDAVVAANVKAKALKAKRKKASPAAAKADATVPDAVDELGNWSD